MEWISVKERLTKEEIFVLTFSSLGIRKLGIFTIKNQKYWIEGNGFSLELDTLKVTHWMPLPDKPKEWCGMD